MEPVYHDVSLLQAHWKDMNQSLMTACYISDQDSDSNNSDVLAVQDSGSAVPSIPFTPIGNHDPAKQLQRAKSAMRRHYYRCSATLKKCGWNDNSNWLDRLLGSKESWWGSVPVWGEMGLTDRFVAHHPLTDVVPTKANSSHVSMTKVMDKVVKTGKGKKLNQLVLDTPEKEEAAPTSGLPSVESQRDSLGAIQFSIGVVAPFSEVQNQSVLRPAQTSRSHIRGKLSTIYETKRRPGPSMKKQKKQ